MITDKNRGEITRNTSYILLFVDSAILMAKSLSNPVINLSEEIFRVKCKMQNLQN